MWWLRYDTVCRFQWKQSAGKFISQDTHHNQSRLGPISVLARSKESENIENETNYRSAFNIYILKFSRRYLNS